MAGSFVLLWVWFVAFKGAERSGTSLPVWWYFFLAVAVILLVFVMVRRIQRLQRALHGKDDDGEAMPPGSSYPGFGGPAGFHEKTEMRFLFFVLVVFSLPLSAQSYTKTLKIDLDRDGKIETLVLDAKRDPSLTIYHGKTKTWSGIPRRWKAWKMTTGDVDGDGKLDIILGVHKSTRFMPFEHNCLFVWGFDGKAATKKWLGSSLSKPFSDFLISRC